MAATDIASMDRELGLYDIAMMTRAGPAKSLGMVNMYGSLAVGADANVAIYNLDATKLPTNPEMIEEAFSKTLYTIKEGQIVVQDGEIVAEPQGHTIWTKVTMPENTQVIRDIKEKFTKSYTVNLENYAVFDDHVYNPRAIEVNVV